MALLSIAVMGVFSWSSTNKLVDNAQRVDHTHEVLVNLERIISQLKDAETGQRGFIITAESHYLEPYNDGISGVELAVANVRMLTADNPSQQRRLDLVEPLIQSKLDELNLTINLRRDAGFESALAVVQTDAGKRIMDDLRAVISEMEQEERQLLEQRASATASTATRTEVADIVGTGLSIVILSVIALFLLRAYSRLRHEERERELADKLLKEAILKQEELNQTLETRIEERTRELEDAQGQLVRSEKLAALGQLAGGVAHDLRNPLGSIKNAVYYINKKIEASDLARSNPKVIQFLNIIDDEVTHSDQIITDLLLFSRVDSPALSPISIPKVIDDSMSRFQMRTDIHLVKQYDADLPEVMADPEQLQRAFMNIASNAQDAMPQGGRLTITARKVDRLFEVAFADTGDGIKERDIERVLEPLFTTKSNGTGLGLAVCQQIVSKHGGAIEVTSKEGQGSTIYIRLPLSEAGDKGAGNAG